MDHFEIAKRILRDARKVRTLCERRWCVKLARMHARWGRKARHT